jgi:hypothetical protein
VRRAIGTARLGLITAAAAAALLGTAVSARAARTDVIVIRNGDHVTGEVVQMQQGKLQVKTDDAGTLSIKWDKVTSVTTAAAYDVTMRDSRRLLGRLRPGSADSLELVAADGSVTSIAMADIVWFAAIRTRFFARIDGSFDLGANYTKSSGVANLSFGFDATYRRPSSTYAMWLSSNVTRQKTVPTTSRYSMKFAYTRFLAGPWFVAPLALFEGNKDLGFTFRGTGGLSVGRYLRRSRHTEWIAGGGLSAGYEEPVDRPAAANVDALAASDFSLFTYDFPATRIDLAVLVFPSLDDPGRVRVNANVKVKREIFKDFYVTVSAYDALDTRPKSAKAQRNDFGGSLSFSWTF